LAVNFPDVKDLIVKVPEDDPMVFTRSIEEQLSSLIIKPLQAVYHSGRPNIPSDPYFIIIDGLDECGDSAMQISILQVISKTLSASQLPLKFLIASRPEVHLTSEFHSRAINPTLARLALDDNFLPDDDIRHFLEDKFKEIRQTHPLTSLINPSWPSLIPSIPSPQIIWAIYIASTIIKYIASTRRLPTASLDVILDFAPQILVHPLRSWTSCTPTFSHP